MNRTALQEPGCSASAKRLSALEAAELLGCAQLPPLPTRYEEEGPDGVRPEARQGVRAARTWVLDEYRTRYRGWTVDHLRERHPRLELHLARPSCSAQAWSPGRPGVAPIVAAGRASPASVMLHQDGSRHEWLAGQAAAT